MSYSIDVNLLLYASDTTSRFHERARRFLEDCAGGKDLLFLAWSTISAYLRIATHLAIFSRPLAPPQACKNIGALLDLPHCRVLSEQPGFWQLYLDVTGDLAIRGNLVPDAHLATILLQHGVKTLYTNDADFLRFPFLEVRNPLV
ncbi:MAG: hypothetical protein JW797_02585 [Bradymonadales bacterium]|nr:hypothetical protein [Bradymonadales bacterium]